MVKCLCYNSTDEGEIYAEPELASFREKASPARSYIIRLMKQGSTSRSLMRGYTIIEVMIVLTVTSALLISALAVISGQQQKTEFSQAIRDIESQLRDTINDVSTGFYNNTGNFTCSSSGGGPLLAEGANNQGKNEDCIFIGRAVQFAVNGTNGEGFNIYDIVGQRQISVASGEQNSADLDDAKPKAIAPDEANCSEATYPNSTDSKTLSYGLSVKSMNYTSGGTTTPIGAVGFISSLSQNGNLESGSQIVNLYPISGTVLGNSACEAVDEINKTSYYTLANPDGGVKICFKSGGTDQNGVITIGSNGRELSVDLAISEGNCS